MACYTRRQSGVTSVVTISTGGALGNQSSSSPVIGADGRLASFYPFATNLIAGDTNGSPDIFTYFRMALTCVLAQVVIFRHQAAVRRITELLLFDARGWGPLP